MRKVINWIIQIVVIVLLIKGGIWVYQTFMPRGKTAQKQEIRDFDKMCQVTNPDTRQCVCIHRQTNEILSIPYDECVRLAREKRY